ncbi:MAG: hypothetical protein FWF94_05785 [Oscillospiraceae bacterium]|nr:hypothetical protein [Oscillospiraceae bacterium]
MKVKIAVKVAVILFGIGLMIFGAVSGELSEIARKATKVCLECIGIG